jgi:sodium/potassium/calcium exchanger 6
MSIAWIRVVATEFVSLLTAFGVLHRLSPDVMGLTVLSWANSVMDFVSDMAMARAGFGQMAVAACLGGPLLSMRVVG